MALNSALGRFFRRFSIWLITFILSILLSLWIFTSFISLNSIVPGVVDDLYDYSSPESKTQLTEKFTGLCSYFDLQLKMLEPQGQSKEAIKQMLLQQAGSEEKQNIEMIFKIQGLCEQFQAKKLSVKQFFTQSVHKAIEGQLLNLEKTAEKDNPLGPLVYAFNTSKVLLPITVAILLVLLFLFFLHQPKLYFRHLGKMLLKAGIFLVIPYLLIQGYVYMNPPDTTSVINLVTAGLSGGPLAEDLPEPTNAQGDRGDSTSGLDIGKLLPILIPLVFQRIYPLALFILGGIFIVGGISLMIAFKKEEAASIKE